MEVWQASQQVARVPPGAVGKPEADRWQEGLQGGSWLQGEDGGRAPEGTSGRGGEQGEDGDCGRGRRGLGKREVSPRVT